MCEMMRSRRNFHADESSCPAAWNPAREFPDFIGSATEPSPITGSDYEIEIEAFLARGGKIQYLPVMPADTTSHDDHQVYLIGKYE